MSDVSDGQQLLKAVWVAKQSQQMKPGHSDKYSMSKKWNQGKQQISILRNKWSQATVINKAWATQMKAVWETNQAQQRKHEQQITILQQQIKSKQQMKPGRSKKYSLDCATNEASPQQQI